MDGLVALVDGWKAAGRPTCGGGDGWRRWGGDGKALVSFDIAPRAPRRHERDRPSDRARCYYRTPRPAAACRARRASPPTDNAREGHAAARSSGGLRNRALRASEWRSLRPSRVLDAISARVMTRSRSRRREPGAFRARCGISEISAVAKTSRRFSSGAGNRKRYALLRILTVCNSGFASPAVLAFLAYAGQVAKRAAKDVFVSQSLAREPRDVLRRTACRQRRRARPPPRAQ